MTFAEVEALTNRMILGHYHTAITAQRKVRRGVYEVTVRTEDGAEYTTQDYQTAARLMGTPRFAQDPALPVLLHQLACDLLQVDKTFSLALKEGVFTEEEKEYLWESLAGMHQKIEEVESRHIGRDYNSLEQAGLV